MMNNVVWLKKESGWFLDLDDEQRYQFPGALTPD